MLFFFIISTALIFGLNFVASKAVDDYEFGGGSFREWRDFEAKHKHIS